MWLACLGKGEERDGQLESGRAGGGFHEMMELAALGRVGGCSWGSSNMVDPLFCPQDAVFSANRVLTKGAKKEFAEFLNAQVSLEVVHVWAQGPCQRCE